LRDIAPDAPAAHERSPARDAPCGITEVATACVEAGGTLEIGRAAAPDRVELAARCARHAALQLAPALEELGRFARGIACTA
jgi:hypothetical protein